MNTAGSSSLAAAQHALLQALFARPASAAADEAEARLGALLDPAQHPQSDRGLSAYRSNGHALAERALQAAYPVVAAVLGDDGFAMLARALWHRHPPQRGDLALWGEALADTVQDDLQLAELPWLADVARVEWALHRAASDTDRWPDPGSFALLQTQDPGGVRLVPAPGLTLVHSPWPVVSIVNAHLHAEPPLEEAWRRCHGGVHETALVWRQGFRPCVQAIPPADAALLAGIRDGSSLAQALDAACAAADTTGSTFDFGTWLAAAVQDGLVLGAALEPLPSTPLEIPR